MSQRPVCDKTLVVGKRNKILKNSQSAIPKPGWQEEEPPGYLQKSMGEGVSTGRRDAGLWGRLPGSSQRSCSGGTDNPSPKTRHSRSLSRPAKYTPNCPYHLQVPCKLCKEDMNARNVFQCQLGEAGGSSPRCDFQLGTRTATPLLRHFAAWPRTVTNSHA